MNCGSVNDIIDFLVNGEKMILCVNCWYDFVFGKLKFFFKIMGRLFLGIIKKVFFIFFEKMWEYVDYKVNGN